ncbi:hypothetical protein PMAYCL1PPCAC_12248 [Pristionchus mayeri]|uniref:Uncharacterized protein n=1 Tax=Pristionchus mayeri TaxID=1317129 RepID=A0AAN4ZIV9_9BILA|nr:hypothetical protein PMAYCL1PPCAC_12248 [Pristionchus mayeri]
MTPSDPVCQGSSVTSPINLNPNLEGESAELDAAWTAFSNAHREQITAADTKVQKKHFAKKWAEMTSKGKETFFAKFGMASGARSGSMERSTPVVALVTTPKDDMVKMMRNHLMKTDDRPSTGSTVMTAEVSKYIVDSLVSLNPLYPTLVDLISTQWHSDEKKKVEIEKGLNHLVSITNTIHKRELTTEHIVHHIQELKKLAIELVNSTGRNIETVYGESVKKVMVEIAKKQNRAAQRVNSTPFLDVISVKPVDQSLLIVQPPKESSMESKSELEKKVNEKSEELKEKEKGENENEGEVLDKQSGFHEARAEPKPPEEETEEGRDEVMTSGDSIFSPSISHWRSGGMKTEELLRPYKRRQKTESLSSRGSMKEWRKEEETEEDFTSIDERSGGRKGRENHWMAMKRAQKNVRLNRYNEKPEDWTPFDVYLKKEYKSWCEEYGEEPSNALALTIKREYWSREGKFYWERRAARYRREGRKRIYWGSELSMVSTRRSAAAIEKGDPTTASETVIEQEDRAVEDKGLKVVPLGGEEKVKQEHPRDEKGNLVSKNEDEYLAEDEETVVTEQSRSSQDDEMIDVEGMEEETPPIETTTTETEMMKEESTGLEEPPKKKNKGGRPKKEPLVDKKKRASLREENEDFMQSGSTPRGKAKKVKPDPNKPLIVDGVPVNPLAEPAVANAYGYDPAKDIVPLGQGQLKSAYRRSKAQLDTPQIDAKRYKLEVKHDHLLDDDDHDDTHRDESEGMDGMSRPTTPHGGVDVMEGINVHIGDGTHSSSSVGSHELPSPFPPNQRSSSFSSRRPVQPQQQAPPLIPHAPSPLAARRISGSVTDGWAGVSGGRRRSDGERRDKTPGGRSPPRKSSHFSPGEVPLTPTTPSTPSALSAAAKQTRLSQAEQFAMAAPKVIDAPRLATPLVNTPSSSSDSSLVTRSNSVSGEEPLAIDVFCSLLERITAEVERANAVMASNPNNGN